MLHIEDAVRAGYEKIIIASPDTDIFVTALYHYTKLMYVNLQELWMFCGKGETTRAVPLHAIATKLESTVVDVLPALHALTGCDTTSKICSKNAALKIADTDFIENLVAFGKMDINIDMIIMAEKFLVKCTDSKAKTLKVLTTYEWNIIITITILISKRSHPLLRVFTSIFKEHFARVIFGIIHAFVKFP